MGESALAPGQSALAHLRLKDEALLQPGDRFIVRQFSPVVTIGGGEVLDCLARRPTVRDSGRPAFLELMERGKRDEVLVGDDGACGNGFGIRRNCGTNRMV